MQPSKFYCPAWRLATPRCGSPALIPADCLRDIASPSAAYYNAGMLAALRKNRVALLLVACHALAIAAADKFGMSWLQWAVRSPAAALFVSATVLIFVGGDLGLIGLWGSLSSCRPIARRLVAAACAVACCIVYEPGVLWLLRDWSYFGDSKRLYGVSLGLTALLGLPLLTIATTTSALAVARRRGAIFARLAPDALQREAGYPQFQISHLMLLTLVLSLLLGFSINSRQWLSRIISMRWQFAFEAPFYSAETVLFSAFCLTAITLATAWAALGYGRPWARLLMTWSAASLIGGAWAFSFTSPRHQEFLPANAAFSAGVGLSQAVLMSVVLLIVRRRGYRFAPKIDPSLGSVARSEFVDE